MRVVRLVGAVPLIGDVEAEIGDGLVAALVELVEHREVGAVVGDVAVRPLGKIVFAEEVVFKAEVLVDVFAVVEPGVAGVRAGRVIAVLPEVPHIGVGRRDEVVDAAVGQPGEKFPFAYAGVARENIGHQRAGIAHRLQLAVLAVDVAHKVQVFKAGEVVVRLQHDGDHVDPLVRGDRLVGAGVERGLRAARVIAVGRGVERVLDGVQKRVDKALGDELVVLGIGVDERCVGGFHIVNIGAGIERRRGGAGQRQHERGDEPRPRAAEPPAEEKREHQRADGEDREIEAEALVPEELVGFEHLFRLGDKGQILGAQRVTAERDLEEAHRSGQHDDEVGQEPGDPRAVGEQGEKEHECNRDGEVERDRPGVREVGEEHGARVCAGGEGQAAHADERPGEGGGDQRRGDPALGAVFFDFIGFPGKHGMTSRKKLSLFYHSYRQKSTPRRGCAAGMFRQRQKDFLFAKFLALSVRTW